MARETARESAIQDGTETPVYQDQLSIVRGLGAHLTETFMGQVLGAGGAGGSLLNVPFQPASIEVINEAGSTPAWSKYVYPGGVGIGVLVTTATADATSEAPALTRVAEGDWTIVLDTADAPDGETVTVIVQGFREVAGSL